jgi:hypothetical protein
VSGRKRWRVSVIEAFASKSSPDCGTWASTPLTRDTMSPPNSDSSSQTPNPTSADVAARRIATDRSIPKASHNAM